MPYPCLHVQNLSAPFIMQVPPFKKVLLEALPYVDFLFGNETEAAAFAESEGWDAKDLDQVALKVSSEGCAVALHVHLWTCSHVCITPCIQF